MESRNKLLIYIKTKNEIVTDELLINTYKSSHLTEFFNQEEISKYIRDIIVISEESLLGDFKKKFKKSKISLFEFLYLLFLLHNREKDQSWLNF